MVKDLAINMKFSHSFTPLRVQFGGACSIEAFGTPYLGTMCFGYSAQFINWAGCSRII